LSHLAKTRVLAVNDDPDALRLVSWQLRSMGYEVVEARSTTEALHILSLDEGFDLLLTGVMLHQEITGLELARRVRRAFGSRIKVILTSGYP
jgi:CheY-like chemotaxis protein